MDNPKWAASEIRKLEAEKEELKKKLLEAEKSLGANNTQRLFDRVKEETSSKR